MAVSTGAVVGASQGLGAIALVLAIVTVFYAWLSGALRAEAIAKSPAGSRKSGCSQTPSEKKRIMELQQKLVDSKNAQIADFGLQKRSRWDTHF